MVKKVKNSGRAIVFSRAASTEQGIAHRLSARRHGDLFFHGYRFTIYTHAERIAGFVG